MVPVLGTVNYIYFRKMVNFSTTKTMMSNFNYNTKRNVLASSEGQHISAPKVNRCLKMDATLHPRHILHFVPALLSYSPLPILIRLIL